MSELCKSCYKKLACKKICKELEEHLKKEIEVKRKEEYLTAIQESHLNNTKTWPSTFSIPEAILRLYFLEHKTHKEIAKCLKISIQYSYQIVKKYKPILIKNIEKLV